MTTTIFNDGVLEAIAYENKWIFVRWLQNTHGRLQKRLIQNLNRLEGVILSQKFRGWFTWSEVGHREFHKLLTKFGAMPREVQGEFQFFIKPILSVKDLHRPLGDK